MSSLWQSADLVTLNLREEEALYPATSGDITGNITVLTKLRFSEVVDFLM